VPPRGTVGCDRSDRDKAWANRGLMQCIADRVPVGVLCEIGPKRRQSQYEVLGLAVPVQWADGYFFVKSLDPAGVPATDIITDVLEATARSGVEEETAAAVPADDYDARLRIYRQIVARQGQSSFRAALMKAYRGRCAITGADALAVLEAAHLQPYRGPDSNTVTNGLLRRADIHTLLDLRLLAPEPETRAIVISNQLAGTQYETFSGCQLADPADWQRPSEETLRTVWRNFLETEGNRQ
jgi:putative restriction endonuclease